MPVITMTTTINEAEIREAIVDWLDAQNAGEGPQVSPDDIVLRDEAGEPLAFALSASVDH